MNLRVAAGSSFHMDIARMTPKAAKGIRKIGHQYQLLPVRYPKEKDCTLLPR
jgi:hypothetical protein